MLSVSLQEAVLRVFANAAVFSKDRRCRIFTRTTWSKENLMQQFLENSAFSIFKLSRSQWKVAVFLATIRIFWIPTRSRYQWNVAILF